MGARPRSLVLSLVVFSTMWLLSVALVGFRLSVPVDLRRLFTSFRARVTWTLFGFFILSNVVFGTLAYRNLTGASERTATALAERVVAQIAQAYREEGGSMESLARRVGAHLLEYRDGELVGGSVDELIELGLYEVWLDPEIFASLESGRRAGASKVTNLGDLQYVLAHRRLPDGDIVASPVPLRAGAAALRRRDVADLLGAAIVLGPIPVAGAGVCLGRVTRPSNFNRVGWVRVGEGPRDHLPDPASTSRLRSSRLHRMCGASGSPQGSSAHDPRTKRSERWPTADCGGPHGCVTWRIHSRIAPPTPCNASDPPFGAARSSRRARRQRPGGWRNRRTSAGPDGEFGPGPAESCRRDSPAASSSASRT